MTHRRNGFTMMDLLGAGAGGTLLVMALLLPALGRARENARQAVCASNLKCIGVSLFLYASDQGDKFPTLGPADSYDAPVYGYEKAKDYFDNAAGANIQHWWLPVYQGSVSDLTFQCPSDRGYSEPQRSPKEKFGFISWRNVSYGLQPLATYKDNAAWVGAPKQDSGTIIAGDKCGREGMTPTDRWTANHYGRGGNALSVAGSVKWNAQKDNKIGVAGNNIYEIDLSPEGKVRPAPDGTIWLEHASDSFLFWHDGEE